MAHHTALHCSPSKALARQKLEKPRSGAGGRLFTVSGFKCEHSYSVTRETGFVTRFGSGFSSPPSLFSKPTEKFHRVASSGKQDCRPQEPHKKCAKAVAPQQEQEQLRAALGTAASAFRSCCCHNQCRRSSLSISKASPRSPATQPTTKRAVGSPSPPTTGKVTATQETVWGLTQKPVTCAAEPGRPVSHLC